MVFIISCIPIITIGPALCALNAVVLKRVRNIPCYVFHEYKQAFKANLKEGILAGLVHFFVLGTVGFATFFYGSSYFAAGGTIYFILFCITVLVFIIVYVASMYLYTCLGIVDVSLKAQLKNSVLMTIAFLPRSAMLLLTGVLPILVSILFIPISFIPLLVIPLVLIHFSWSAVIINMNVWATIEKAFIKGKDDAQNTDEQ